MKRFELVNRVRILTRDLSNSIFRESDIVDFLNEGIDRVKQLIPELHAMAYLTSTTDVPKILPSTYHNLLAIYSASRCFFQDERHYQATNLMNEFETKLEEIQYMIDNGRLTLVDDMGTVIDTSNSVDYVTDNYFDSISDDDDIDNGVNGVM